MGEIEIDAGYECSGNSPNVIQGLASNGRWTGVALQTLFDRIGVKSEAREAVFFGSDSGEETVDFRPTSGPPSLLGRETAKTKKGTRHISPISPTKQESIGTEEFGPPGLPPLLPESRPADPRTPDMLLLCFAYAMFIGPLSGAPPSEEVRKPAFRASS